jgi:hypothetical protein
MLSELILSPSIDILFSSFTLSSLISFVMILIYESKFSDTDNTDDVRFSLTSFILSFIVELTDDIVESRSLFDSFRDYSQLKPTESIYLFVSEIDSVSDDSTELITPSNYSVADIILDVIVSTDRFKDSSNSVMLSVKVLKLSNNSSFVSSILLFNPETANSRSD